MLRHQSVEELYEERTRFEEKIKKMYLDQKENSEVDRSRRKRIPGIKENTSQRMWTTDLLEPGL